MFRESKADDENLYDFNAGIENQGGGYGQKPPMSAYKPPATSTQRPLYSSMGRNNIGSRAGIPPGTAMRNAISEGRPMTSISGAGYHANKDNNRVFDPLNVGKGHAPPLAEKGDNSNEEKAKEIEKSVHKLYEASAEAITNKDYTLGLEKAKEAGKSERLLKKFKDNHGLSDQINTDLTYAISFNLANAYYHNKMYDDAIKTYEIILKNKQYPQSTKIRINMGNIYFQLRKYPLAIKMYRMSIDQIPSTGKCIYDMLYVYSYISYTYFYIILYIHHIDSILH